MLTASHCIQLAMKTSLVASALVLLASASALQPATAAPVAATRAATASTAAPALVQDGVREGISHYNLSRGLALSGYDPVAYFPEGGAKPAKGSKKITATRAGVTYRFSSNGHRDLFNANPTKYEPAYGGWCAYAMAMGSKTDIDPKNFRIQDERLMVFYKGLLGGNTRTKWVAGDVEAQETAADGGWQDFSGEAPPRPESTRAGLEHFNLADGLALRGYDPVSYFGEGPARGSADHELVHAGVTYRFASEDSMALFQETPAKYEPAFGGWCAFTMSQGSKFEVDPTSFLIQDNQLMLFYKGEAGDTRKAWLDGQPERSQAKAKTAWREMLNPAPAPVERKG